MCKERLHFARRVGADVGFDDGGRVAPAICLAIAAHEGRVVRFEHSKHALFPCVRARLGLEEVL